MLQRGGVNAALAQLVELADQHARVDDDAVADDAGVARVQDARRDEVSLKTSSPRMIVWPALLPPWKRTITSARSARRSVTLPLPSSPHWAPTMTVLGTD